jgi:hypothetical protein
MGPEAYNLAGYIHSDCINGSVWLFKEVILAYCHSRVSGHVERKQWDSAVSDKGDVIICSVRTELMRNSTAAAEFVPWKELQPKAFGILPYVFTILVS